MTAVDVDWGERGLARLLDSVEAIAIVDVLSFSTCVSVAADRGIAIYPVGSSRDGADLAARLGARLARRRTDAGPGDVSLSPASLRSTSPGGAVVLPSPNGSALSALASARPGVAVYAGCLRNRRAVAMALAGFSRVGIVAAGERWPDDSLRPAIEDWLGAGALVDALADALPTAEAELARTSFRAAKADLARLMVDSLSGRELTAEGHAGDVAVAAELDGSDLAPRLTAGAYKPQAVRR